MARRIKVKRNPYIAKFIELNDLKNHLPANNLETALQVLLSPEIAGFMKNDEIKKFVNENSMSALNSVLSEEIGKDIYTNETRLEVRKDITLNFKKEIDESTKIKETYFNDIMLRDIVPNANNYDTTYFVNKNGEKIEFKDLKNYNPDLYNKDDYNFNSISTSNSKEVDKNHTFLVQSSLLDYSDRLFDFISTLFEKNKEGINFFDTLNDKNVKPNQFKGIDLEVDTPKEKSEGLLITLNSLYEQKLMKITDIQFLFYIIKNGNLENGIYYDGLNSYLLENHIIAFFLVKNRKELDITFEQRIVLYKDYDGPLKVLKIHKKYISSAIEILNDMANKYFDIVYKSQQTLFRLSPMFLDEKKSDSGMDTVDEDIEDIILQTSLCNLSQEQVKSVYNIEKYSDFKINDNPIDKNKIPLEEIDEVVVNITLKYQILKCDLKDQIITKNNNKNISTEVN